MAENSSRARRKQLITQIIQQLVIFIYATIDYLIPLPEVKNSSFLVLTIHLKLHISHQ